MIGSSIPHEVLICINAFVVQTYRLFFKRFILHADEGLKQTVRGNAATVVVAACKATNTDEQRQPF